MREVRVQLTSATCISTIYFNFTDLTRDSVQTNQTDTGLVGVGLDCVLYEYQTEIRIQTEFRWKNGNSELQRGFMLNVRLLLLVVAVCSGRLLIKCDSSIHPSNSTTNKQKQKQPFLAVFSWTEPEWISF
jgi:hypothetical protein